MSQEDRGIRHLVRGTPGALAGDEHQRAIAGILNELRLYVQSAQPSGVAAVALSSNGEKLASVHYDNRVRLWDLRRGVLDKELCWFDFDEECDYAGTVNTNGTAVTWVSGDQLRHSFAGQSIIINKMAYKVGTVNSATSLTLLVSAGVRNGVTYSGVEPEDSHQLGAVSVNEHASLVAGGTFDYMVRVWDAMSGEAVLTVEGSGMLQGDFVSPVALSRTGRILAMGSEYILAMGSEHDVELWNVRSRKRITRKRQHWAVVNSVAISSQGDVIASGSLDGKIHVYYVRSKELRKIDIYREHRQWSENEQEPGAVSISGDGRFLARLYPDGTVQRYDLIAKDYLAPVEHAGLCGTAMAMSSTGMMVGASSTQRDEHYTLWYPIKIFDVTATPPVKIFDGGETPSRVGDSHDDKIHALSFSADGNLLASASLDGSVKLWWTKERRCLATLLAAGPGEWLIHTPDCRFTGSEEMIRSSRMWFVTRGISSEASDSFRNQSSQERVAESLSKAFGVRPQAEKARPRMSPRAPARLLPPGLS